MAIKKKKLNSFSHYSFLISRFGKISPIIKFKTEPVASQSRKPWLKETPPDLEGVPRPTLAARTRAIHKRH
jgi:hypothetical protein